MRACRAWIAETAAPDCDTRAPGGFVITKSSASGDLQLMAIATP